MNDTFTQGISRTLLILFFMLAGFTGFAQYTKTSLETGRSYSAMAKDQSGNLYIVRSNAGGTAYELAKYTNGTGTPSIIYSTLQFDNGVPPIGLAVNSLGDVFVTSLNAGTGWEIIKLAAPAYTPSVIHSGSYYSVLAIDPSNNLLSLEYDGTGSYQVVRYPFGAEQLAGSVVYNGLPLPSGLSTTYPAGLVTNSQGDIFLTDFHENSGGRLIKLTAPGFGATTLATNRGFTSLAVDASDNLYTTEATSTPNVSQIVKYTDPTQTGQVIYNQLSYDVNSHPWGLAVMANGNIFANNGQASEVVKLSPPTINVASITRLNTNPTPATTVSYTVTFSGAATGVTTSSFNLTTTGLTGAFVSGVTGSGTTYTVTVNTGTDPNGTVRLDVNGTGISPVVANVPYTAGQVYNIDRVAPGGSLVINGGAAYTNNPNVTLTLTGSDVSTPLQMAFSIDGGAYSALEAFATTKTVTLSAGDGLKTVAMQLRDAANNTAIYNDNITLDQTPPNTTIVTNPANPTNLATATFTFTSNETGSTFEARLDAGAYVAVTSPQTYTGLADGNHTFNVRAVDRAGNVDPTPAPYNWDIDATGPVITGVSVPANGYYKAGDVLQFKVKYNETAIVTTVAGTPYINIIIGLDAKQVPYISGSGTDELTFSYTVQPGEMDANGITVNPLVQNNSGFIRDAVGNDASTTLQNVASTTGVLVNTSIPSVTLSTTAPTPTNAAFTVTVTFSEAVAGLTVSDFNVLNTTVSNLTTSDNITYTVLMTPASDGTRTISLPANSVVNIGGNSNTASNTITYTYDATAPTVASVAVPANKIYKAGETMMFAVNFSENILLNTTGGTPSLGLTLATGPVTAIHTGTSVNSLTFTYTVVNGDMDMDGIVINSLALNGATLRDAATNNANLTLNSVAPTTGVRVNTAHPSVTITSAAPAIVNAPFNATITFSEAVSNFIAGDITVTNANITNFSTSDNIVYTVQVTPVTEGNVSLNVAADVAENIGTNGNTVSNTLTRLYDIAPPAITAVDVPINGYYKAGDVMNFTVHFSENITINTGGGNPYLRLTIGSTLVNTTYTGTSGTDALTFGYTVLDGQMDMNGIEVSDFIPNGSVIRDAANNAALVNLNGVGNTTGVFVNTQHPSVVLATSAAARINVPFSVTVTFSEAVTGLTASDFSVTNGTAGTLTGSNATYTMVVTPTSDGTVSISLPADVTTNIGDNGNTASNTISLTYDATAPAVSSVAVPVNGYYKAGTTLDFTVRFNEDVIINTTNGTPTLVLTIGSTPVNATYTGTNGTDGLNFSYTVVNGDMDMDGIMVNNLALNSSTIKDAATNNAVLTLNGIGNTTLVRVNTTHPTVTVTTAAPARTNAPFIATITFSEAVTGFTAGDVAITNGTPGTFSTSDNITYTLEVIPATEGTVSVNVPADAAVNIGDNGNTASNTISLIYDITGPTVITVGVPNDKYYRAGDVMNFNVHFDEAIILNTTGGTPYITITIGSTTVNASYNAGNPTTLQFSYTVANGDEDMDGITVGTLNLNGATIQDAATNNANLTLFSIPNTSGVRVNTTGASVTLSSTANALINAPFTITATFSQAVTGLTAGDFVITNGTASNLQTTDNTTYTLVVTPVADGPVTIQVPVDAAVNIGNNGNTASNVLGFTYDATAPVVTAVTVPANGYYKQGDVLNFTVDFSENIFLNLTGGAPYLNVTLGTTTVQAAFISSLGNQLTFSYTVQPGDMDLDGITIGATLNANGGIMTDMATNNANLTLNNIGNTSSVFVHTGSPSVQLSTAAAARVNAPFTVTAVFNEAVTGLAAGDFTITNGTGSNLQTTDNITYTLLVTPTADGGVTIQLPAGQADNVVSNSNTASNTLNVTYDATAPAIAAGQSFEILERSTVGTQVGQVTATDASGILTNWTITSDDSNGAFSIDANGNIIVADQAKLNSKANSTVTLTITVSDGLNTSTAVPVTVMVKFVNQAPTLNVINDETVCPDAQEHTIQLTGASATEPGQTYGFTVITDKPNFDKLSVSATGVITYQLKASATGTAAVTVTIKDNGGTANGGIDTLRRTFNITVATLGQITITSDKGNTISKGDVVHLTATGGTIFRWDDADGIISGQQEAVLEARPMENTTYHVTVSNDAGCTNTADFTVTVVPDFKVEATNLLTPNGDGKNDKWVIRNLDSYPDNEVQIFDRAGRLVYNRRNYSNDWDGTMNGSPLGEGTYYYVLKIQGGAKTAKGYITIIRDRN